MKQIWTVAAAAGLASAPVSAQDARPEIGLETARDMEQACLDYAAENDLGVAIAIFDDAGILVTYARMDQTAPAAQDLAHWKGQSAARYRTPTARSAEWDQTNLPHLATVGGGIPIFDGDGNSLGGIGVSGAPVVHDIACGMAAIESVGLTSERPAR